MSYELLKEATDAAGAQDLARVWQLAKLTEFQSYCNSVRESGLKSAANLIRSLVAWGDGDVAGAFDLAKLAVSLNPWNEFARRYAAYFGRVLCERAVAKWPSPIIQADQPVTFITSCVKNLAKAVVARESFGSQIASFIVVGDATQPEHFRPIDDGILSLRVPDDYDSLPRKTAAALEFLALGAKCAWALKVDDDIRLANAQPLIEAMQVHALDYVGAVVDPEGYDFDRCWHIGKCSNPDLDTRPYDLPSHSKWCKGGTGYVLSYRAILAATYYLWKYPGLLRDEIYEDKLIGNVLHFNKIEPVDVDMIVKNVLTSVDG